MSFGQNLLRLRKQKGLSQDDLGGQLKVSRQTISKWELGETTPEMEKLVALGNFFEVSLDELIKGEKEDSQKVLEDEGVPSKKSQRNIYDVLYLGLKMIGALVAVDLIIMLIYFCIKGFPTL